VQWHCFQALPLLTLVIAVHSMLSIRAEAAMLEGGSYCHQRVRACGDSVERIIVV
jgi:hypothetical protein